MMQIAITENALLAHGWQRKVHNPAVDGGIPEYWKSIRPKWSGRGQLDLRLGIYFREWSDEEFVVWLFVGNASVPCRNIRTIEQLAALYELLVER